MIVLVLKMVVLEMSRGSVHVNDSVSRCHENSVGDISDGDEVVIADVGVVVNGGDGDGDCYSHDISSPVLFLVFLFLFFLLMLSPIFDFLSPPLSILILVYYCFLMFSLRIFFFVHCNYI